MDGCETIEHMVCINKIITNFIAHTFFYKGDKNLCKQLLSSHHKKWMQIINNHFGIDHGEKTFEDRVRKLELNLRQPIIKSNT